MPASARTFVSTRGFVLAFMLLLWFSGAGSSYAQDQTADVRAALDRWATSYGSVTDSKDMLKLYHPDAVFWGTAARQPFVNPDQIANYFGLQFSSFPKRQVSLIDPVIRVVGDAATATGLYRFQVQTAAGQAIDVTHRFSFTLVKTDTGWLILHQHSSQLPAP